MRNPCREIRHDFPRSVARTALYVTKLSIFVIYLQQGYYVIVYAQPNRRTDAPDGKEEECLQYSPRSNRSVYR